MVIIYYLQINKNDLSYLFNFNEKVNVMVSATNFTPFYPQLVQQSHTTSMEEDEKLASHKSRADQEIVNIKKELTALSPEKWGILSKQLWDVASKTKAAYDHQKVITIAKAKYPKIKEKVHRISVNAVFKICQFIEVYKQTFIAAAERTRQSVLFPLYKVEAFKDGRSLQFHPDGRIFVLFDRWNGVDYFDENIGNTETKDIHVAMEYFSCTWFAVIDIRSEDGWQDKELVNALLVQRLSLKRFTEIQSYAAYSKKESEEDEEGEKREVVKKRISLITTLGDFSLYFYNGLPEGYTLTQKFCCALQVATALFDLHRNNLVYCDMKPHNVLLRNKNMLMCDLASIYSLSDVDGLKKAGTSVEFESYEAMHALSHDIPFSGKIITKEHDIYGLGRVYSYIFNTAGKKGFGNEYNRPNKDWYKENTKEKIMEKYFPEPKDKDSVDHLVWEMHHIEPDKRPKIREVMTRITILMNLSLPSGELAKPIDAETAKMS